MSDGFAYGDIIVIAAIAAFIILRYRSMLGEKRGHDVTPKANGTRHPSSREKVVQLYDMPQADEVEIILPEDESLKKVEDTKLRTELEEAKAVDPSFTLDSFLQGAKQALEMVLQAYNEGDRDTLKMLLNKDLYASFDDDLKKAEASDTKTLTTLVAIKEADLRDVTTQGSTMRITVAFLTEQIHVVKDKQGKIIEGDASLVEDVSDEWQFERNLKSRNPNWTIVDM
tara:strand:- start:621 stop:1301 length:681 start_codon:yes stop_codon:yes gene_type:complete